MSVDDEIIQDDNYLIYNITSDAFYRLSTVMYLEVYIQYIYKDSSFGNKSFGI